MTPQELRAKLNGDTTEKVDNAIGVYLEAKSLMDAFKVIQDEAKQVLADVMEETGKTRLEGSCGTCTVTEPSFRVSYDTKALDALLKSSDEAERLLAPHRNVTPVAGSMRITGRKR